jgi:hypothetical protein
MEAVVSESRLNYRQSLQAGRDDTARPTPAVCLRGQAEVAYLTGLYSFKTSPSGVSYYERDLGQYDGVYSKYLSYAGGRWYLHVRFQDGAFEPIKHPIACF